MFYLRGLLVSLSVFVLLYGVTSAFVCATWPRVQSASRRLSPRSAANVLYALRLSPVVVSVLVVLGLCVPSFLRLEPHATGEALGAVPVILALVFMAFAALSAWRAWNAYARTERSIRYWTTCAAPLTSHSEVTCFHVVNDGPPVALAGIAKPALVISAAAAASLSPRELSRTVEHELAHLRARDNLKKLLLHACAFPFMNSLERAWLEAVEYSADSDAVHNETEALELASALVKISRLTGCGALPELASGFVEGPISLLQARVQRLIEWRAVAPSAVSTRRRLDLLAATLVATAALVLAYPSLLKVAHRFTEMLVH
jgi:beta-lactamase regulating signal transducer with metallopeptidase domain